LPRLLDQVSAFRYVTAENAHSYRAIMQVFFEARERYEIELRPADVRDALARSGLHHDLELTDEAELDRHLDQLDAWGNLQRSHDTAAVARVEDFYRRRFLYRLTPVGEAAHKAVCEVEATVGRSGALQTSMLVEIRDALSELAAAARAGDAAGLARALHRLRAAFDSLTEEANLFLSELDRHASGPGAGPGAAERVDEERFLAHKQALLAYLGRFVADLKRLAPEQQAEILNRQGISGVPAIRVGTEQELLSSLAEISLESWATRCDALPQRFAKALEDAAKLLEPKAVRVTLPSATIRNEEELRAWLDQVETKLRDQLGTGPVIV